MGGFISRLEMGGFISRLEMGGFISRLEMGGFIPRFKMGGFLSRLKRWGFLCRSYPGLTEDLLEDYSVLTYLSKGEVLYLMKKFCSINPEKLDDDYHHRFSKEEIVNAFQVLRNNPFQDRIFKVFSSKKDDCFCFEDLLDLCSVMNCECPNEVKAAWAFRVFDLDDDNQISVSDISGILDRLVQCSDRPGCERLDDVTKTRIANFILEELKLDSTGSIGVSEFKILMSRIPEFQTSFYFRL